MPGSAVDLGTIYSTVELRLQKFNTQKGELLASLAQLKKAMSGVRLDPTQVQAGMQAAIKGSQAVTKELQNQNKVRLQALKAEQLTVRQNARTEQMLARETARTKAVEETAALRIQTQAARTNIALMREQQTQARIVAAQAKQQNASVSNERMRQLRAEQGAVRLGMQIEREAAQQRTRDARAAAQEADRQRRAELSAVRIGNQVEREQQRAIVSAQSKQKRDDKKTTSKRWALVDKGSDALLVGGGATAAGLALANDQAMKFQATLTDMRNNTQMTDDEFKQFSATVLRLGTTYGADMSQIADSFRTVKDLGFNTADAINIVTAATRSAVASNSDQAKTTEILAQVLHSFSLRTTESGKAMNVLHQASLLGHTSMEQFVDNARDGLAIAGGFGLKLQDVAAVYSTLTRNSYDAAEANTQLRSILQHIVAPGAQAQKTIAALSKATGIDLVHDFSAAGIQSKGLTGVFQDLSRATAGHTDIVLKLINAQRGGFGAFLVTGKGAKDLRDDYQNLNDTAAGKLDPTTEGLNRRLETQQQQIKILNNKFQEMEITIGDRLMPAAKEFVKVVGDMLDRFNRLPKPVQDAAVKVAAWGAALSVALGTLGKIVSGVRELSELIGGAKLLQGLKTLATGLTARLEAGTLGGLLARGVGGPLALVGAGAAGFDALSGMHKTDAAHTAAINAYLADHPVAGGGAATPGKIYTPEQQAARARDMALFNRLPSGDLSFGAGGYVKTMLDQIGQHVGYQCGEAVSKALKANGINSTVTALLAAARRNPAAQVRPDASGNYPSGTVLYFPKGGGSRQQHFAVATNTGTVVENTTAGGGGYHYRADRTAGQIAAEHGGQVFAFNPAVANGSPAPGWYKRFQAMQGGGGKHQQKLDAATQMAMDDIYSLTHNEFQNRRHDAQQKYQDMLGQGVPKSVANQWLSVNMADIRKDESAGTAAQRRQHLEDIRPHVMAAARSLGLIGLDEPQGKAAGVATRAADANAQIKTHIGQLKAALGITDSNPNADTDSQDDATFKAAIATKRTQILNKYDARIKAGANATDAEQERDLGLKMIQGEVDQHVKKAADAAAKDEDERQDKLFETDPFKNRPDYIKYYQGRLAAADPNSKDAADFQGKLAKAQDMVSAQKELDTALAEANKALWEKSGADMSAYYAAAIQEARDEADDFIKRTGDKASAEQLFQDKKTQIEAEQAESERQLQDKQFAYAVETHQKSLGAYKAYLQAQAAALQVGSSQWIETMGKIREVNKQLWEESTNLALNFAKSIPDELGKLVGSAIEHTHKLKTVWKDLVDDMRSWWTKAIEDMVKKWVASQLFGMSGSGNPFSGGKASGGGGVLPVLQTVFGMSKKGGASSGAGGDAEDFMSLLGGMGGGGAENHATAGEAEGAALGLMGAGGGPQAAGAASGGGAGGLMSMVGMLSKNGLAGLLGHGLAAAMPWVGGGLLLNNLLGNPFGKLFKHFHLFASGGMVPGAGHHDSVPALLTPGEFVMPRAMVRSAMSAGPLGGGGGGGANLTINHNGDINNAQDVQSMYDNMSWMLHKKLQVANAIGGG